MYLHLAGAVCSSFLALPWQASKRWSFKKHICGFPWEAPENICAEYVSNLEVLLLRVQRSDCGIESLKTKEVESTTLRIRL